MQIDYGTSFRKLFTTIDSRLRFTADNLSDYSRYFNEYDYTEWNEDNFSNFPTLYINKDKERAKKQVLYVFSPRLHLLTFFLDNLLKFIVNLQPVIKI